MIRDVVPGERFEVGGQGNPYISRAQLELERKQEETTRVIALAKGAATILDPSYHSFVCVSLHSTLSSNHQAFPPPSSFFSLPLRTHNLKITRNARHPRLRQRKQVPIPRQRYPWIFRHRDRHTPTTIATVSRRSRR